MPGKVKWLVDGGLMAAAAALQVSLLLGPLLSSGAAFVNAIDNNNNKTGNTTAIFPISSPSVEDSTDFAFRQTVVAEHNRYRGRHRMTGLLTEDTDLLQIAQLKCLSYALKGVKNVNERLFTVGSHGFSENLWSGWTALKPTLEAPLIETAKVVADWYLEGGMYQFNEKTTPIWNSKTAHFSALIWNASKSVGCGRCVASKEDEIGAETLVLCLYYPPGNVIHRYAHSVNPLH